MLFLLSPILLLSLMLSAQVQTQHGVSYSYNGKNPRTPLPNVTIECLSANNTVISDSNGDFELVFNKLKIGDRIGPVRVKKREMMVFNHQAVEEWSIRKEPLCLILCDANEFERQKQELINIGKHEAQKKYDRQKAELEQQLEASQIDRTKYEVELDKAWEELDRLHKHIDEYADLFARIDQSEIDTLAQQAMDLFNRGQVNEAVRLFEQGNYLEKLKADNRTIQQADQLIENAKQGRANAEKDKEEHLQSLNAQIAAYKVQNEWEKAGTLLKGLADELNTVEEFLRYANFCVKQNELDEAEAYFNKADALLESISDKEQEYYLTSKSSILYGMAGVYKKTLRYKECESSYNNAINLYNKYKNNPIYDLDYARTLNNLGDLYNTTNQFDKSEEKCLSALRICEKTDGYDPEKKEYIMAETLNNLGVMYARTHRFEESETMYLSAMNHYQHLGEINPSAYEFEVFKSLFNLAGLYLKSHRYDESESSGLSALKIAEKASKVNPAAYWSYLGLAQRHLGDVYYDTQRLKESESYYLLSLDTYEHLAELNPIAFQPELAGTMQNLANVYGITQRFEEDEAMSLRSLQIYEHLAETNPSTYKPNVANLMCSLAIVYSHTLRFDEGEKMFLSALEIYQKLAESNPAAYKPSLQTLYNNLGVFYQKLGRFDKCEAMTLSSLELANELSASNPTVYEPILAKAKVDLGTLYSYTKRYEESESMILSGLEIYERLAKSDPSVYLPILASTYHSAAVLYYYTQQFDKSAAMYESELEIFEQFAKEIPDKYETYVADNLYSIGLLRLVQEKYSEGLEPFERAIEIYKRWLPQNPSILQNYYGATHWISHLYAGLKNYSSAYNNLEDWLLWAKESQWKVSEFDSEEFENISKYAIYDGRLSMAEQWAVEGLSVDSTRHPIYTGLAASLLLQGKYDEAETIYRQYKDELKDNFLQDFNDFEVAGVIPEERKTDVERIKQLLMQ